MAAFQFTPGAIDHWIVFRQSGSQTAYGSPAYLGTAVTAPETEGQQKYIDIFNDLGGRSVPFQLVEDGCEITVATTLNRYDNGIYATCRNMINTVNGSIAGIDSVLTRGQLVQGQFDFQLWLVDRLLYVNNVNPCGRIMFSSELAAFKESTAGTRVREVGLAFRCTPLYIANPGGVFSSFAAGSFALYKDAGPADFGTLVPN